MIKHGKKIKIIALILLGIGAVLLGIGLITGGSPGFTVNYNTNHKNFRITTARDYEEKILEKTQLEKFENIQIDTNYKDIIFKESDDYYIEYVSSTTTGVTYKVKNGTLYINDEYKNSFNLNFFNFNFNKNQEYIIIYMPKDAEFSELNFKIYEGDLTIRNVVSTVFKLSQKYGDFQVEHLQADKFDIYLYEGDTTIKDIIAGEATIKTKYGELSLERTTIKEAGDQFSGRLEIDVYEGAIKFNEVTGKTLALESKYADISGEQLDFTNIKATTYEGDIRIGELNVLVFDLKSKYGNIHLGLIESESDYAFNLKAKYGTININNRGNGETYSSIGNLKNEITINSYEGNQNITTN